MTERVLHAHFAWAGGHHRFALPLDERSVMWHQVRDPHPRLKRFIAGDWTIDDVSGTIRGGLIGGRSADLATANELVAAHVHTRPLAESGALAKAILMVALFGIPAEWAETPVDVSAVMDQAEAKVRDDEDV